jgi:hypothetical protein
MEKVFSNSDPLGLYFHLYSVQLEQSLMQPSLELVYQLYRGEERVQESIDSTGNSVQFFSGQRVVIVRSLSLQALPAGRYRVVVKARDRLTEQEVKLSETFRIEEPSGMASKR